MNRTEYMIRLATQKKFAYVSEDVSVTSILSTSTFSSPEKTLSPFPEENDIYNKISSKTPSPKNIIIHSNIPMPRTYRTTPLTESKLVTLSDETDPQDGVKLPGFSTIGTEIASELENTEVSLTHSKTSTLHDGYEIIQESTCVPDNDSKNATFREHSQEWCGTPNPTGSASHFETVFEDSLPYMQTNIQGGNSKNFECTTLTNMDFIETPVTKSDSILEPNVYDGPQQFLVSAFDESDLKEDKRSFDDFEDFYSSGSDYIPSSCSTSTSSDIDEPEKFDNMEVKKTYSKRNPIGQLIKASEKVAAEYKEVGPRIPKVNRNQGPEQDSPNLIFNDELETISGINKKYVKNPAARERPTLCPICYHDVVTHFPRHLFRHHADHKDVKIIQSLKAGSSERLAMISAFRKQGYFHLSTEKDFMNPVRSSKDPDTQYFVCTSCLGYYSKKNLYKHVKICKNRPADSKNIGRSCLSRSQTFMASARSKNQEFLRTSRIMKEVFHIMRADNISEVAKNDPLICLYGDSLLAKHKRQQIATMVSNKVREMARMLITIKSIDDEINSFFEVLSFRGRGLYF